MSLNTELNSYVATLKKIRENRQKITPVLPKTPLENEMKGYLKALNIIITDLEEILTEASK